MYQQYTSLGLMSGTSGDGVDASVIISNGIDHFEKIIDKYFEYDSDIFQGIHSLKENILNSKDIKKFSKEISEIERKITFFHAKIIKELESKDSDILVGFHGQTIFHNPKEKISFQLGDGRLLNQLTQKKIIFNFRKNDIINGGEGAPLTPLFHQLITLQKKIELPVCILNIGGISNITLVKESTDPLKLLSKDLGPGNCLIDSWVRNNSSKKIDYNGKLAAVGKTNEIILEQAQELYANRINKEKKSFDTSDFDISFARGLSLEDGAATITEFSASIIAESILSLKKDNDFRVIIVCGGGRKNMTLIQKIKKNLQRNITIDLIDEYGVDGDFIESQAFAFLAIRTYKKLPISFPSTTNCIKPCIGGEIIEN